MNREVRCPSCSTVFALDMALLKPNDPRVRCGECGSVFNATAHLADDSGDEFVETGVGWVVVASRDARPTKDVDGQAPRYVPAGDNNIWDTLGSSDEAVDAPGTGAADPADGPHAETAHFEPAPVALTLVSEDEATPEGASEPADDAAGDAAAAADLATPAVAGEAPARTAAGNDWQSLLDEIDTLPDAAELAPAETETETADSQGGDNGIVVSSPTTDNDAALTKDNAEAAVDLEVDGAMTLDAGPAEDIPAEPSDADIMREFTVSESDFQPADDAFVEAVFDQFVLAEEEAAEVPPESAAVAEGAEDDIAPDATGAIEPDRAATAAGEAGTDNATDSTNTSLESAGSDEDEALDTSGIFVSETLLPEHEGEARAPVPASAPAVIAETAETDDALFETAIGLAPTGAARPGWVRYAGLLAVLLTIALAAQILHQYRAKLATNGSLNPLYTAVYGDALAPAWNIREMCFEQRDASAAEDTMRIVGRVRNRGTEPLPYPLLHITLLSRFDDGTGPTALAHRLLEPAEYSPGGPPGDRIAAGEAFDARARLRDPGPDAAGYELEVCYRRDGGQLACNSGC